MSASEWGAAFGGGSNVYDELLVPRLFIPWAQLMLDLVAPTEGESLIDVACGPGSLTRLAAARLGPSGRVLGTDLNAGMLDVARAKDAVPGGAPIAYVECPADALDAPDDTFDVVTCQQGLQFFPDRRGACAEMRRVCRDGARLGASVWRDLEECPPFHALSRALAEALGADVGDAYASGPWGWTDPDEIAATAAAAGFSDVEAQRHAVPIAFEGGPAQLFTAVGASPLGPMLAELDHAARDAVVAAVTEATRAITHDGEIHSEMVATIVLARA